MLVAMTTLDDVQAILKNLRRAADLLASGEADAVATAKELVVTSTAKLAKVADALPQPWHARDHVVPVDTIIGVKREWPYRMSVEEQAEYDSHG